MDKSQRNIGFELLVLGGFMALVAILFAVTYADQHPAPASAPAETNVASQAESTPKPKPTQERWGEPVMVDEVRGTSASMQFVGEFVGKSGEGIEAHRSDIAKADDGRFYPVPNTEVEADTEPPERLYRMMRNSRLALWVLEKRMVLIATDGSGEWSEEKRWIQIWIFADGRMTATQFRRELIKPEAP